MKQDTIFHIC